MEFSGDPGAKIFESSTAALVGFASAMGWHYVMKNNRLISSAVTREEAYAMQDRILAEPLIALITIPCAFIGPIVWEISWLSYPLVVRLLKRRRPAA